MSVEAAHGAAHEGQGHGGQVHEEFLMHQFEDRKQQDDAYIVGMWAFLVQEVMFFGALFLAYTVYRFLNPEVFFQAHRHLDVKLGFINTTVLLTSSLFMALAVRSAMLRKRKATAFWMVTVVLCACAFMVIKSFEYHHKWEEHLIPGPFFHYENVPGGHTPAHPISADKAQMFFCLYFAMTGLHGIHVLIGILILVPLIWMVWRKHEAVQYYMPIEMFGLYWHFVDIVWIFLFPLYYLIPR